MKAYQALPEPVQTATGTGHVSESLFKRVYRHTFVLALPSDSPNVRSVPVESASEFWRMLLGPKSPGLAWVGKKSKVDWLELWLEFVQKSGKAVSRDLWMQTLNFAEKSMADESLSFWSEEDSWPGIIDEFVAFAKEKNGAMDTS